MVAIRKNNKRSKRKIKKNRKKIEWMLIYLKIIKTSKVIFNILILVFILFLVTVLYKSNIISKVKKDLSLIYSNLVYKNICTNIEINGLQRANIQTMQEKIYNFCNLKDKNNINLLLLQLNEDPWIKDISIRRKLPNTLKINIKEYLPFAIWKDGDMVHLLDENGNIIQINEREKMAYYNLLIVAGEESKENIYSLFNLLSSNPDLFSRIRSALRIGKRRWNLELDNGILIKMPETNMIEAWKNLEQILDIKGSEINLKVIDLRNKDKIFLEEK